MPGKDVILCPNDNPVLAFGQMKMLVRPGDAREVGAYPTGKSPYGAFEYEPPDHKVVGLLRSAG